MRIAVAVVAGVVALGSMSSAVHAAEARRQRSEYCIDGCNLAFERCQAQKSAKDNGRCNIDAVKCKNDCPFETIEEPAVPTAQSHGRCVDACRDTYKKCLGKAENKRGGNCAADDVRCEQACPKPPAEVAAVPPGGSPEASAKKPKRAARVEGAAAPAPPAATPAAPIVERVAAPPPAAVPERAAPAAARSEAVTPPAESAAAARPEPQERGFFAKIGCFFYACDKAGSTPCLDQCATAYDECRMRESKRGGECNTRLMNCRQSCRDAAPAAR
jgi:hypothetical protein